MAEEFPLHVLYRIDTIQYKIEYLNDYLSKQSAANAETVAKKQSPIDFSANYLVFLQLKPNNTQTLCFYNQNGILVYKHKTTNFSGIFEYLDKFMGNIYLFLKNVRKEFSYLKEYKPDIYTLFTKYKFYCFETYLKYELCLPLFVQGKVSKRYRIPTMNEYLEKKSIKPLSPQKSEYTRFRKFISFLVENIVKIVNDFHWVERLNTIPKDRLGDLINYILMLGFEKNHIVIITDNKRRVERLDGIDYLSLEQFYKYITNYKKNYEVILLENVPDTFKNIPHVYLLLP